MFQNENQNESYEIEKTIQYLKKPYLANIFNFQEIWIALIGIFS